MTYERCPNCPHTHDGKCSAEGCPCPDDIEIEVVHLRQADGRCVVSFNGQGHFPCAEHAPTQVVQADETLAGDREGLRDWLDQNTRWRTEGDYVWVEQETLLDALATIRADAEQAAARALVTEREWRDGWAGWLEGWSGAVCPEPPTIQAVIGWLRSDQTPFGVYAHPEPTS